MPASTPAPGRDQCQRAPGAQPPCARAPPRVDVAKHHLGPRRAAAPAATGRTRAAAATQAHRYGAGPLQVALARPARPIKVTAIACCGRCGAACRALAVPAAMHALRPARVCQAEATTAAGARAPSSRSGWAALWPAPAHTWPRPAAALARERSLESAVPTRMALEALAEPTHLPHSQQTTGADEPLAPPQGQRSRPRSRQGPPQVAQQGQGQGQAPQVRAPVPLAGCSRPPQAPAGRGPAVRWGLHAPQATQPGAAACSLRPGAS
jgi:hypothetical protein